MNFYTKLHPITLIEQSLFEAEYNIMVGPRPFSDQVMLLTDQCSRWLAICADQIFYNCNSLLLVFITCDIIVIIIVVSLTFLTKAL